MNKSRNFKPLILCIMALTLIAFGSKGALDKKFYNKVADQIWNTPDSLFDATVTIPDSLIENNSAIILAWSDDIDLDHVVQNSIYTSTGQTNRLVKNHVSRQMIKLLDQSAIDDYSEFEFGHSEDIKYRGFVIYQLRSAFGARIHKPDGTIREIDLSEAIELGDGKKGNDNKHYKIAIPGLEPGDILDFFKYYEELAEQQDLEPDNYIFADEYPLLKRRLNITTHPKITVEYKTYNGVPALRRTTNEKGFETAERTLYNIPGVNFKRFTMPYRQLPFVRVQYLNNNNRRVMARNARSGGIYGNIHTGKIISEFGDFLHDIPYSSPINGRAVKMVKDNFVRQHPDATPREIADAAYLAVLYQDFTGKNDENRASGQFERSLIFNDVLRKLDVYPVDSVGIGLITARDDVPTSDISSWKEATFVVKTPDAVYYMRHHTGLAPGEMPGLFKGETALLYMGDRKELGRTSLVKEYVVPGKKISENTAIFNDTVTIDEDVVRLHTKVDMKGAIKAKRFYTEVPEWTAEVEDFFAIAPDKRYKDKSFDEQGRRESMRETMKDLVEEYYGLKPDSVTAVNFISRGIRPDAPDMTVEADMEFGGLIENLGNDISVSLGKIAGMPAALTKNERERLVDVMLPYVSQFTHVQVVKAPEGYAFDPASVESLSRNVNELVGMFFVLPAINDDGDLVLTTSLRYKFADIPLNLWPDFRKIIDEAAAFSDEAVLLVKK